MISYGATINPVELPIVNNYVSEEIAFINEIKDFISLRAAIEKEYGKKLWELGKKFDKRLSTKVSSPRRSILRNSSIHSNTQTENENHGGSELAGFEADESTAGILATLTNQIVSQGAHHLEFGESLIKVYSEDIKSFMFVAEEARKKISSNALKQYEERDKIAAEKDKVKARYEDSVHLYSLAIQKQEKVMDNKAQKYQDKVGEYTDKKNQYKNEYIIWTEMCNSLQTHLNTTSIPQIMDDYQALDEIRIITCREKLKQYLVQATQLCEQDKSVLQMGIDAISKLDPSAASAKFINSFERKTYQPVKSYIVAVDQSNGENPNLETDKNSILIMSNRLIRVQAQLREIEEKIEEAHLTATELKIEGNNAINESYMNSMRFAAVCELKRSEIQAQISCVSPVVGNVNQSAAHLFEPRSFKIPTKCNYCEENIWGTSRKGAVCTRCGYVCHAKCELRVEFNCPGGKDQIGGNFLTRAFKSKRSRKGVVSEIGDDTLSVNSSSNFSDLNRSQYRSSLTPDSPGDRNHSQESFNSPNNRFNSASKPEYAFPVPHGSGREFEPTSGVVDSSTSKTINLAGDVHNGATGNNIMEGVGDHKAVAKALYSYTNRDSNELCFNEGETIYVLSDDDGSGWVLAKSSSGNIGHAPVNYLEFDTIGAHTSSTAKEAFATALYDFEARSGEELSFKAGDKIKILGDTESPEWVLGSLGNLQGRLPRNYIE